MAGPLETKNEKTVDFAKTQQFVAKKHNIAIIRELLGNPHGLGFNLIAKKVSGITPRILSTRLKELEKSGLLKKNLVLGIRPRIEYLATPKAEGLRKAIAELEKWGKHEL